jgi:hypothetical protein
MKFLFLENKHKVMTERCMKSFEERRRGICAAVRNLGFSAAARHGGIIAHDKNCLREHVAKWTIDSKAKCDFCLDISHMGAWESGRVVSEVEEYVGRHLQCSWTVNICSAREAVFMAFLLLELLNNSSVPVANPVYWAAICGGELALFYEPPAFQRLAEVPSPHDLEQLADNLVAQWWVLGSTGWSHPGVFNELTICFSLKPVPAIGWRNLSISTFTATVTPKIWESTRMTFLAFAAGKGYNAYTPMIWMLQAASIHRQICTSNAWTMVFGAAGPTIRDRVCGLEVITNNEIANVLTGVTLSNQFQKLQEE